MPTWELGLRVVLKKTRSPGASWALSIASPFWLIALLSLPLGRVTLAAGRNTLTIQALTCPGQQVLDAAALEIVEEELVAFMLDMIQRFQSWPKVSRWPSQLTKYGVASRSRRQSS